MPCPVAQQIFASIIEAMQPAEEIGGPESEHYADLMLRIATEALTRARNFAAANDHIELGDMAEYSAAMIDEFRAHMMAEHKFAQTFATDKETRH